MCRKIIDAKLKNKDAIDVWGDGKQTRSFCFVEDLIEALIRTMECEYSNPINLGNPFEISIHRYLLSMFIENIF